MSDLDIKLRIRADSSGANRDLKNVQESVRQFGGEAQTSGLKANAAIGTAGEGVNSISRQLEQMRGVAASAFAQLGAAALAAVVGGGMVAAIHHTKDFNMALREVSTLVEDVGDMGQLRSGLAELGRDYGAPTQQAKGLYQVISAGVSDSAAAMDVLNVSNRLAVGGVTDVFTATDGLTTALNAYQMEARQASSVSDAFFVAMRGGKTTIGELAGSIGRVAPLASTAGVALDELLAGTSALTTAGVSTAEAMTQLRAVISGVLSPSAQALQMAEQLGIEFNLTALRAKGLADFLDELREATGGSADAIAQLFGSVEAQAAVFSLTGAQAQTFTDILDQMGDRAGATDEAVKRMRSGWDESLRRIKAFFTQMTIMATDEVMSGLAPALSFLADNIETVTLSVGGMVAAYTTATVAKALFATGTGAATAAMALFNKVVLANPLVRMATLIGGAVAAIYALRNQTVSFGDDTVRVGALVQALWAHTFGRVIDMGRAMWAGISGYFRALADSASVQVDNILALFGGLTSDLFRMWRNLVNGLIGLFVTLGRTLGIVAAAMVEGFRDAFGSILDIGQGFWQSLQKIFEGDFSFSAFRASLNGALVDPMIDAVRSIGDAFNDAMTTDYLGDAVGMLGDFASSIVEAAAEATALGASSADVDALATSFDMATVSVEEFQAVLNESDDDHQALLAQLQGILDIVDPAAAALRQLEQQIATVRQAQAKGLIDPAKADDVIKKLREMRAAAEEVGTELQGAFRGFVNNLDAFADGVRDSVSTLRDMHDQGSASYKGLTVALNALNAVQAINAVLNQSAGDPYTAFARMAAMAASVAALGQSVGRIGRGGADTTAADRQAALGSGGVLGDSQKQSESLARSSAITASATQELVGINRSMLAALQSVQAGIGGASTIVARALTDIKLPDLPSRLEDLLGAKRVDEGLYVQGGDISDLLAGDFSVGAYGQYKAGSGWGASSKKHTEFVELDNAIANQFTQVYQSIADSVTAGAEVLLGDAMPEIEALLSGARIDTSMISLDNLSVEEQAAALETYFSKVFDDLSVHAVPWLEEMQRAGESLGTTLARVAASIDVTREAASILGFGFEVQDNQQSAGAAEQFTELAGGIDELARQSTVFVGSFMDDVRQFEVAASGLNSAFAQGNSILPRTREEYVAMLQAQDVATESGAETAAMLLRLQGVANDYYNMLDERVRATVAGDTAVFEAYRNQRTEIEGLIAAYDGSTWAADALNDAYTVQMDLAYVLSQAWEQVGQRAQDMLGKLSERIRQDLMGEQELYEYRRAQAHALSDSLKTMADPAQISATVAEIEQLTSQMWQSLAEDQREAMGAEFLAFLDGVDAEVQQRMENALSGLDAEGDSISKAIDRAMSEAAQGMADASRELRESSSRFAGAVEGMQGVVRVMQSAAGRMQDAANTPIRVRVTQTVSEVG